MVSYREPREYITPIDAPISTVLSVTVCEVITNDSENRKTHKPEQYHRVIMTTGIRGVEDKNNVKCISINLSDDISPQNRHGRLVAAVFGPKTLKDRTYTDVQQLIGKNLSIQVTGWKSKMIPDTVTGVNKIVYFPDIEILPGQATPVTTKAEVCDNCQRPIGKVRYPRTESGEEYVFCSVECDREFSG